MPHLNNRDVSNDESNYFVKVQPVLKYWITQLIINLIPVTMLFVMMISNQPGNLLEILLYIFSIGYGAYYIYLLWKNQDHDEIVQLDTPTVIISILIVVHVANGTGYLTIPGSVIALFYLLKWYLFPSKNRQSGFLFQDSWILYRSSEYSRVIKIPVENLVKVSNIDNHIKFSYSDGKEVLINLRRNRDLSKIVTRINQFVTFN